MNGLWGSLIGSWDWVSTCLATWHGELKRIAYHPSDHTTLGMYCSCLTLIGEAALLSAYSRPWIS